MKIFFGWNDGETPREMCLKEDVDEVCAGLVEGSEMCLAFANDESLRRRMAENENEYLRGIIRKLMPQGEVDKEGSEG